VERLFCNDKLETLAFTGRRAIRVVGPNSNLSSQVGPCVSERSQKLTSSQDIRGKVSSWYSNCIPTLQTHVQSHSNQQNRIQILLANFNRAADSAQRSVLLWVGRLLRGRAILPPLPLLWQPPRPPTHGEFVLLARRL